MVDKLKKDLKLRYYKRALDYRDLTDGASPDADTFGGWLTDQPTTQQDIFVSRIISAHSFLSFPLAVPFENPMRRGSLAHFRRKLV